MLSPLGFSIVGRRKGDDGENGRSEIDFSEPCGPCHSELRPTHRGILHFLLNSIVMFLALDFDQRKPVLSSLRPDQISPLMFFALLQFSKHQLARILTLPLAASVLGSYVYRVTLYMHNLDRYLRVSLMALASHGSL